MTLRTKTELKSEISSRYADNAIGAIGSDDIQTVSDDTVDSLTHEYSNWNLTDTGIFSGGELSVNANETTYDLTAGVGYIVDNVTDPTTPVKTEVTWDAVAAGVITNLATEATTFIGIEDTGSGIGGVVQQSTEFTASQRRSIIEIGRLSHFNNTTVRAAPRLVNPVFNPNSLALDMAKCFGALNCSGNKFSAASTDLTLAKTSGVSFRAGINWGSDNTSVHTSTDAAIDPISFSYIYRDGAGGYTIVEGVSSVNPGDYDDGSGTLDSVNVNQFSVQRIYFYPGSNTAVIAYGTEVYGSLEDAQAGWFYEDTPDDVEFAELLAGSVLRSVLVVKGNASDLSDSGDAKFANLGKGL